MNLQHLAFEVEQVFKQANDLAALVEAHSCLTCPAGCGKCCDNPAIEVYPIEFLPLAVYLHEQKLIDSFLEQLNKQQTDLCPLYLPGTKGCCTAYQHRGLICRLMGYSAVRGKYGKAKLIACRVFKGTQAEKIPVAEAFLNEISAPFSLQFYDRLKYILPSLSQELLPIKLAVKTAVEYVASAAFYQQQNGG